MENKPFILVIVTIADIGKNHQKTYFFIFIFIKFSFKNKKGESKSKEIEELMKRELTNLVIISRNGIRKFFGPLFADGVFFSLSKFFLL